VFFENTPGLSVYNAVPDTVLTLNLFLSAAQPAQPFSTPDVAGVAYGQLGTLPQDANRPFLRVQWADGAVPVEISYRAQLPT
jgi:hypothetical protein